MSVLPLAWLVAFAVRYGLSPAVPEIPSVGSGKAKGKRIRSCSTRSAWCRTIMPWGPKHLRAMTSMLPSLRLRGVAPACKYLLCDTAVHLHLLRAECRSWPRRLLDVGRSSIVNTLKRSREGIRHGSSAGTYDGAAVLTQLTQNGQSCPSNQDCIPFLSRRALRLTLSCPQRKKILGASHLPDLNARSAKERRRPVGPRRIIRVTKTHRRRLSSSHRSGS
ncbi:hypothetical protein EDB85DRAFT_544186 [Lactarius pseudohatsudake]|nr:hypothetical protein EDB85DRAFT_544186 [Lactarius pseudohatsudake]